MGVRGVYIYIGRWFWLVTMYLFYYCSIYYIDRNLSGRSIHTFLWHSEPCATNATTPPLSVSRTSSQQHRSRLLDPLTPSRTTHTLPRLCPPQQKDRLPKTRERRKKKKKKRKKRKECPLSEPVASFPFTYPTKLAADPHPQMPTVG